MTTVSRQDFSQKSSHDAVAPLPGNATPFWHLFIASSLTGKHPDRAYITETMVDGKAPPFSIFLNCRYLSFESHRNSLFDLLGTSLLSHRIHPWQFSWTSMEFFESQELKYSLSYSRRSAEEPTAPESKICQTLLFRRHVVLGVQCVYSFSHLYKQKNWYLLYHVFGISCKSQQSAAI